MSTPDKPARKAKGLRRLAGPFTLMGERMRATFRSVELGSLWQSLTKTQREFAMNVLIASLAALGITLFHESQWLESVENSAMDLMMELNKGLPRMADTASDTPLRFTMLDIDDESFRRWAEPFHTPRDKVQELLEYAAGAGARLIVLDIDTSRPGIVPEQDANLAAYLSSYGENAPAPPLILVRSFYSAENAATSWDEIRPSFLDEASLPDNIHWAQPLFRATLADGIVRHWHLVKAGCLNGRMEILPSVQLVAAIVLGEIEPNLATPVAVPGSIGVTGCQGADPSDFPDLDTMLEQRIIYTMGWQTPSPDLVTVPAHLVADAKEPLAGDPVRDRVVVIGASHVDSRDIHRTPIGPMPGALIIANSIKSLTLYGQIERPPTWLQWVAKLSTILFAAWIFLSFRSLLGVLVAGAAIMVALMPISFYFFKYGLWVDFALPLLAMIVHRGVAEYRGAQREAVAIGTRIARKQDKS